MMKSAAVLVVVVSALGVSADLYAGAPPLITSASKPSYSTQYEYYDACTDTDQSSTVTTTFVQTYYPDEEEGHGGIYGGGN